MTQVEHWLVDRLEQVRLEIQNATAAQASHVPVVVFSVYPVSHAEQRLSVPVVQVTAEVQWATGAQVLQVSGAPGVTLR